MGEMGKLIVRVASGTSPSKLHPILIPTRQVPTFEVIQLLLCNQERCKSIYAKSSSSSIVVEL
jgi:hypothetical protein